MMLTIALIIATILIFVLCKPNLRKKQLQKQVIVPPIVQEEVQKPKQARPPRITDSKLRRVSLSTNQILFTETFELNEQMAALLPSLSTKYRLFLIT